MYKSGLSFPAILAALVCGLLLAAGMVGAERASLFRLGDTDRYYHFALSRELAQKHAFWLETLPQAEDLGWGRYFPDKEYFFHVVTSLAYRAGGDAGVEAATTGIAVAACLTLYASLLFLFTPWTAALIAFSGFFAPAFLFRILLVRPHVLAMFCFLVTLLGILRRRPVPAGIAGALFALSYHAFYLPLICAGAGAALSALDDNAGRKKRLQACGAAIAGILVGVIVNPYFPSNLEMAFIHARISFLMKHELSGLPFGTELYPLVSNIFFQNFWLPLAVLLGSLAATIPGKISFEKAFLLLLQIFFLLVCFQSPRGSDYLYPVTALLLAVTLLEWKPSVRLGVAAVLAAAQAVSFYVLLKGEASQTPGEALMKATWPAVALIPEGKPVKTYNCEWDRAPFLFYARPQSYFVDTLDPSFLYFFNPPAFQLHEALRMGFVADPHDAIRGAFHADYVLCRDPGLIHQLRLDPGFRQLYPREADFRDGASPGEYLFEVNEQRTLALVTAFTAGPALTPTVGEARQLKPDGTFGPLIEGAGYLDFRLVYPAAAAAGKARCAFAYPGEAELRKHAGARWVGVGGGQTLRLWRNGSLLFTGSNFPRAQSVQQLIPLASPVQPKDRFALLVCSTSDAPFWGGSLAFWTESELAALCAWKAEKVLPNGASASLQSTFTSERALCAGEAAVPEMAPRFRAVTPERN